MVVVSREEHGSNHGSSSTRSANGLLHLSNRRKAFYASESEKDLSEEGTCESGFFFYVWDIFDGPQPQEEPSKNDTTTKPLVDVLLDKPKNSVDFGHSTKHSYDGNMTALMTESFTSQPDASFLCRKCDDQDDLLPPTSSLVITSLSNAGEQARETGNADLREEPGQRLHSMAPVDHLTVQLDHDDLSVVTWDDDGMEHL